MLGWILIIVVVLAYEAYAIATNEYDTFSEIVWKINKRHWFLRWVLFVALVWVIIHLVFGPCALGIC